MKAKAFMYVSVVNFVAVTGIVFNEMSSHGWITEQQASGMAFVLQAWVLLIIASVLNDLLDLGIGSEDRFGRRGGLATGVLVVTFTLLGATSVPAQYQVQAGLFGGLAGLLAAAPIVVQTRPVAGRLERLGERMEEGV